MRKILQKLPILCIDISKKSSTNQIIFQISIILAKKTSYVS